MLLPKNWRNPSKYCLLAAVIFISACSTRTTNVRPSFDKNRVECNIAARPSHRKTETAADSTAVQQADTTAAAAVAETEVSQQQQPEEQPTRISSRGGEFRRAAEKYLGVPYRFGGTTRRGFDCSGFVWRVFQDVGHTNFLRETSQAMFDRGTSVSQNSLREGDLVFFRDPKNRKKINHVGIYIDGNRFIHSSSSQGVVYTELSDNYWKKYFAGFRRLLP